ncbi:DUF3368 domain-containing protein [Candidatus Woesearchaeota archaeon]|nr:DUF3368 domain-containing protein [Candidatus Woesearchaeota archaeon]
MIINASPLIIFGKLNKISILIKIYKNLGITNKVYEEVVLKGIEQNASDAFIVKQHIDNKEIKVFNLDKKFLDIANKIQLIYNLDIGEAETIALALQLAQKEIIIDETAAREAAKSFGIKPIGSLRVLLIAYQKNLISKKEINDLLAKMQDSKYRFSPKVLIEFWELFEKLKK